MVKYFNIVRYYNMRYMSVELVILEDDLPKMVYSEIDDSGTELRKIELYENGKVGYAFDETEVGNTFLADQVIPSVEEINKDSDFFATLITKEYFEKLWLKYTE